MLFHAAILQNISPIMQDKTQNISPVKQRILQFIDTLDISKRDFYSKTGISRGTLESKTGITEDTMAKFIAIYKDVSIAWLISGEGEMLNTQNTSDVIRSNNSSVVINEHNDEIRIPLVHQFAVAGFGNSNFSIQKQDVKDYYVVPKFKYSRVDFMIEIYGSSMNPTYNSGDVIACTILKNKNYIQWNRAHIIATKDQGLLCKRIKPSDKEGFITAISDNPDYPPFDIPCNEVTGIALIVGVIRAD